MSSAQQLPKQKTKIKTKKNYNALIYPERSLFLHYMTNLFLYM